ncbi:hypothetical protein L208DRAFT_1435457 [Tricholoma matsutake]|nr:hypothetical protein L208DRAFT_1435457 [Tricholoma matsutake 945]
MGSIPVPCRISCLSFLTMGAARLQKRRKLGSASSSPVPTIPSPKQHSSTRPICISCHRAVNSALIICPRCSSPTCAICSRTCTLIVPSVPPTPHLTRSPTPMPMSPSQSPCRPALALQSTNTNLCDLQSNITHGASSKRRKAVDQDDSNDGQYDHSEFDLFPGCGRTTCRNCCFEDVQSNSTTCYDCYSR